MKYKIKERKECRLDGVSGLTIREFVNLWRNGSVVQSYRHHPTNLIVARPEKKEGTVTLEMSKAMSERKPSLRLLEKSHLEKIHDALWCAKTVNGTGKVCLVLASNGEVLCKMGKVDIHDFGLKSLDDSWYDIGTLKNLTVLNTMYTNIENFGAGVILVPSPDNDNVLRVKMGWPAAAECALVAAAGQWFDRLATGSVDGWMHLAYHVPKVYEIAKSKIDGYINIPTIVAAMKEVP